MTFPAQRVDESGERLRLLSVHAHPDDESSKGAATMAKYVAEGADVWVATCTGGERGSILNPAMDRPDVLENMAAIRKQEMENARKILGVHQVWLGFVDSGLPEGDPKPPLPEGCFGVADFDEAVERLVAVVREFRPHVMTTYDENGGYPHPDHIRCHEISVAAFEAAGKDGAYPDAGPLWQPLKLYYHMGWRKRTEALDAALRAHGLESPYEERLKNRKFDPAREERVTTSVNCGDYFEVRDRALLAHATQIDPKGHWFAVPLDIQREAWPTEEFELARTLIDTSIPEDDLFAGIPTRPGPSSAE